MIHKEEGIPSYFLWTAVRTYSETQRACYPPSEPVVKGASYPVTAGYIYNVIPYHSFFPFHIQKSMRGTDLDTLIAAIGTHTFFVCT